MSGRPVVPMTDEMRVFIRAGFHRLACTPYSPIVDGPKQGRLYWHDDLRPAYGAPGCLCVGLVIKVNGVPL